METSNHPDSIKLPNNQWLQAVGMVVLVGRDTR
jgi:hypothetical protein